MPRTVEFSNLAKEDLRSITGFTVDSWGIEQAAKYIEKIRAACALLLSNPELGRLHRESDLGLRRLETGRHVIVYRASTESILIVRILHERMIPARHLH